MKTTNKINNENTVTATTAAAAIRRMQKEICNEKIEPNPKYVRDRQNAKHVMKKYNEGEVEKWLKSENAYNSNIAVSRYESS